MNSDSAATRPRFARNNPGGWSVWSGFAGACRHVILCSRWTVIRSCRSLVSSALCDDSIVFCSYCFLKIFSWCQRCYRCLFGCSGAKMFDSSSEMRPPVNYCRSSCSCPSCRDDASWAFPNLAVSNSSCFWDCWPSSRHFVLYSQVNLWFWRHLRSNSCSSSASSVIPGHYSFLTLMPVFAFCPYFVSPGSIFAFPGRNCGFSPS